MTKNNLLSREARLRANGLLDMLYTPAELADELGIDQRDIYRRLLPAGIPCRKDKTGHIWLHGPEIAQWVQGLHAVRRSMGESEAYCLKCRSAVPLRKPVLVNRGKFNLLQATCPQCGTTVNRGVKGKRNDQSR